MDYELNLEQDDQILKNLLRQKVKNLNAQIEKYERERDAAMLLLSNGASDTTKSSQKRALSKTALIIETAAELIKSRHNKRATNAEILEQLELKQITMGDTAQKNKRNVHSILSREASKANGKLCRLKHGIYTVR